MWQGGAVSKQSSGLGDILGMQLNRQKKGKGKGKNKKNKGQKQKVAAVDDDFLFQKEEIPKKGDSGFPRMDQLSLAEPQKSGISLQVEAASGSQGKKRGSREDRNVRFEDPPRRTREWVHPDLLPSSPPKTISAVVPDTQAVPSDEDSGASSSSNSSRRKRRKKVQAHRTWNPLEYMQFSSSLDPNPQRFQRLLQVAGNEAADPESVLVQLPSPAAWPEKYRSLVRAVAADVQNQVSFQIITSFFFF